MPSEDEFDAALHVHVHVQSRSSVGESPRGTVRDRPAAFFWRDPPICFSCPLKACGLVSKTDGVFWMAVQEQGHEK